MTALKSIFILVSTVIILSFSTGLHAQAPQIIQQPSNVIKCIGNSAAITIVATGAEPITYSWFKDGMPYGPSSPILNFPSLTLADEGAYYCVLLNGEGTETSFTCQVQVVDGPPVINNIYTEHNIVCVGLDNLFESDYVGEYTQVAWYHDGNLVGYGADYLLESATLSDEGGYYYTAENVCLTQISGTVSIDVVVPAQITTQPQTQTICEGEDADFSAIASGDYLYYIWMRNDVLMPAEQSNSLTVENVTYPHSYYYNLIAYNVCDHDTSNTVLITVNNMPQIVGEPIDHSGCASEAVTLYAYAGGTTEVSYQWFETTTGEVEDAIEDSFMPLLVAGDTSYYYCEMTNICGTVSSEIAQVVVFEAPQITQQPAGGDFCIGQNVNIQIKARGTETLYYQWLFNSVDVNGANITGAEEETMHIIGINLGQQGLYSCHVSNECGYVVSNQAQVNVNTPPVVAEQPEDMVVCEGEELILSITGQGTEPVSYEWYLLDGNVLMGTSEDYQTDYAEPDNSGEYYCILTNLCGEVSTDTVSVEIRALPVVTLQPVGDEVCVGEAVSMEIEATGAAPVEYLWYRNGSPVSAETNSLLTYTSAQVNQTGNYFCRAMNDCGYDDSETVLLSVGTPPAITWNPIDQTMCELDTLNLIMDAQGDNYTLQWYFGDSPISGENDTVLNIPMVDITDAGTYHCIAFNACASVSTDIVDVIINEAPELDLGDDIDVCSGEPVTIGPNQAFVHYEWNNGISYQQHFDPPTSGTYILEVIGDNACYNRDTIVVTFHPYHQILFGDETIIACGPYVLNAGAGAYSYVWNTIPAQVTSSINVTTSNTYSVTVQGDAFGCVSSQSVLVDVRTPISFELGQDVSAPVDSFVNIGILPIFSEYVWNTGFDGPALTVYGSSYGVGTHDFWLTAMALNGCSHTDTISVAFYNGAGIEISEETPELIVFPNPATDFIRLETESNEMTNLEIYNISGQLIATEIINSMEFSLNVSNFAKGLYLVKIQLADNIVITRKILIQ